MPSPEDEDCRRLELAIRELEAAVRWCQELRVPSESQRQHWLRYAGLVTDRGTVPAAE